MNLAQLSAFHFMRPWWFLALVPAAMLLVIMCRRQDAARAWRGLIADHLLPHLLSDQAGNGRIGVIQLLAVGWLLAIVALAGPTWQREPSPFAEDNAALVIVIKVTPSMKTEDVQPDRLARSIQKIHDLLAIRRGAKTALIAYSGSAHVVMPMTTDDGIINAFAESLDPQIMPKEGDAAVDALKLADKVLAQDGTSGSILWIMDGVGTEEISQLASWKASSSTPIRLLVPLVAGSELDSIKRAIGMMDAPITKLTPDEVDVTQLAKSARFSSATSTEKNEQWKESGYWLTPVLALLMLPFFRRGWLLPTSATT